MAASAPTEPTSNPQATPNAAGTGQNSQPVMSAADLKKEIDDDINRRIAYDQAQVDKLVVLVGIYTTILSFLALGTVAFNRQDAKEQLTAGREALTRLQAETRAQLGEVRTTTLGQLSDLQEEIRRDIPEIHRLHGRILEIMHELQSILPDEADWNDNDSYRGLTEGVRQEILVSEFTVAALTIFNLERAPMQRAALANIDRALARFYIARHNTSADHSEADYERARFYASESIRLEPEMSRSYRLRGAIALGRFDTLGAAATPDVSRLLLQAAEADLLIAISRDTPQLSDAGAHYNEALVRFYSNDLDGAIRESRRSIGLRASFTPEHREKYLSDMYVNLACYLARKARQSTDVAAKESLSQESVRVFRDGVAEFQPTARIDGGLDALLRGLRRELAPGGDLDGLEDRWKDQLHELLTSALAMPAIPEPGIAVQQPPRVDPGAAPGA